MRIMKYAEGKRQEFTEGKQGETEKKIIFRRNWDIMTGLRFQMVISGKKKDILRTFQSLEEMP